MAKIKPFNALRPISEFAEKVAALPYDVVSTEEAREIAKDNRYSFFHVSKPEIDMQDNVDPYCEEVYSAGKAALRTFIEEGVLKADNKPSLYLYSQKMGEREQTGIVACVSIDDYIENRVKKHELTREDKELDRTRHLDTVNANTGPVFMLFKSDSRKNKLIERSRVIQPVYDFVADDGVRHTVRVINDQELIDSFVEIMEAEELYIADGHHRAASAVRVGKQRRQNAVSYSGDEEYNFFLSVLFPHSDLKIMAYNRAVRDLNGRTPSSFLDEVSAGFEVFKTGKSIPTEEKEISVYLDSEWYTLRPKGAIPSDPVESLDVRILQDRILDPILGINDPRKDSRISFIGGIRGALELEKLVNSGKYAVAFSMYPTTIEQLISVSDAGLIMPPKSTWFEPKLRSGLFVHLLD